MLFANQHLHFGGFDVLADIPGGEAIFVLFLSERGVREAVFGTGVYIANKGFVF